MHTLNLTNSHTSREVWEKDNKHFIHPYTNFDKFRKEGSVIFSRGDRHHIYDHDGKGYLDGIAGLWCVNIGHGRKEMAAHLAEQAEKLAYYNTFEDATSPPSANLAAKLAELCPGTLNHVFFGTGGSVANDTAVKLAHYYFNMLGKPNKKMILSRDLGYHGSTYLAHALTGIQSTHQGFDLPKQLIHYLEAPYSYRKPQELSEEEFLNKLIKDMEDTILRIGADNIACYIAEPIMGAGGVIVPPEGYHQRTHALCKKYDILYISDEVVTAFGRLGHMITSKDRFGIEPDILILAKGLSSGYIPLGATVISDAMYEVISQPKKDNPYFTHGFTYSGHALACAAGLKNIEIMENENLCRHVQEWGPYFKEQLETLQDLPLVGDIRGSHYMLAIEYVTDKAQKTSPAPELSIGKRVYYHAKDRGLIIRPIGSLNVLSPPLTYDREAIDSTINILAESIQATAFDLNKEGLI